MIRVKFLFSILNENWEIKKKFDSNPLAIFIVNTIVTESDIYQSKIIRENEKLSEIFFLHEEEILEEYF